MSSTPAGPIQAGAVLLELIKDGSDRDVGVERPGDVQLLDPRRLDFGQDEVLCSYFDRTNSALVVRPGYPDVFHPSHLGEMVVLREPLDVRVVVRVRVAHESEVPSVFCLVDGFREDHAGGAASGSPSEDDYESEHNERLVETLEFGIARICGNGTERVARLLENSVDVGEIGHDAEGGGACGSGSV